MTRLAAVRLLRDPQTPAEMKVWLGDALGGAPRELEPYKDYLLHARVGPFPRGADGLAFWAVVPDLNALMDSGTPLDRVKKVEPFGVPERALHYVDVELFNPDPSHARYRPDLSGKPRIEDIPRDPHDPRYARAGMLPFRVEQCYRELVKSIRAGRLNDRPAQFPRDEHAAKWAGFLAHYVQDNTQPHHATEDYKSASYFASNPRTAPNVHADVEYRLVDDEYEDYPELRAQFWDLFVTAMDAGDDPAEADDLVQATLEVSLRSYDALPLIGQAAVAAYPADGAGRRRDFDAEKFFHFKGRVGGREMTVIEMKGRQMASAVRRTQRLWLRAWHEADVGSK